MERQAAGMSEALREGATQATTEAAIDVVINADDLGYSEAINQAIEQALRLGRISSATLMANAPATSAGLAVAGRHPEASFGIHLNLTEFAPLSDPVPLQAVGLLDASGRFYGNIRSLRPSQALREACFQELDAQISHLLARGLRPSHLDSHHHIHTIRWMLSVVQRLQRRHGIRKLRNTMNVYGASRSDGDGETRQPSLRLRAAKSAWRMANRLGGSRLSDVFTGLHIFLDDPSRPEFLNAGSIELMCHPGQDGFETETARLLDPARPLLDGRYRLRTYRELLA
jgi:predicted glycoside hydrolase/deacetylase ChbG (UPF0249 family)